MRDSTAASRVNRAIGHRRDEGIVLLHLGNSLGWLDDYDEGLARPAEGREILAEVGPADRTPSRSGSLRGS